MQIMSSQIILYTGPGSSATCAKALEEKVQDLLDMRIYRTVHIDSFARLSSLSDPASVKALFVPGGYAPSMLTEGQGAAHAETITSLIDRYKVSYYGTCAGGIIACADAYFPTTKPYTFVEYTGRTRLLKLYPHGALAPLLPFEVEKTENPYEERISIKNCKVFSVQKNNSSLVRTAYILGPGFFEGLHYGMTRYKDLAKQPIAVNTKVGTMHFPIGNLVESVLYTRTSGAPIVLTGSHLEIESNSILSETFKEGFITTKEEQSKLATELEEDKEKRNALLQEHFINLHLQCRTL
ncbi:MAG: hypothetical protein FJZ58_06130 [Chlamydiae bacterium]|nr:hypothetical protein [Chlamydiota bacterium]